MNLVLFEDALMHLPGPPKPGKWSGDGWFAPKKTWKVDKVVILHMLNDHTAAVPDGSQKLVGP